MHDLNAAERLQWEQECLAAARRGEAGAFAELYRAYAPLVLARVLFPKLGNREAAEDALSETFRAAFERLETFEERGTSFYFWVARIAANKALDMHRARKTTGRALASFEGLMAPLGESPPQPGELFEERSDIIVLRRRVGIVLSRLNPRYRRAVELRFVEEKSREECAQALDVKLGTFDVLMLRALRAFKQEWSALAKDPE